MTRISLADKMREKMEEFNLGSEFTPPILSTGIDVLDYKNGRYTYDEYGAERLVLGVDGGKIIMIVGEAGTAKTTLALQIAKTMITPYLDYGAFIQHQDFERATTDERAMNILGIKSKTELNKCYVHPIKGINTETTFQTVKEIVAIKNCEEELKEMDKKERKKFKNPFTVSNVWSSNPDETMLLPTPLIIDSLSMMQPKNFDEEDELAGNMSAAVAAKRNASFFRGLIGDFIDGNIVPIIVNHINKEINTNMFAKPTQSLNFLAPGEIMPGGKMAVYLANTLWKLEAGPKLTEDKEFGIKGFIVRAILVKSRSNAAGNVCELVYDQVNGFDNILTNFLLLKQNKLILGSGIGFYLKGYDSVKFSQKNFKEKYLEHDGLKRHFDELVYETLIKNVPKPSEKEKLDIDKVIENENEEFEKIKEEKGLIEVEFEGIEGRYWQNPNDPDEVYNEDGQLVEFVS
jgi:hypothetical protein